MLFSPSKNTIFINSYTILIEVFIGFTTFALFFGVFANYFYENYLEQFVLTDLEKAITFYEINTKHTEIKDSQIKLLEKKSIDDEIEVSKIDKIIRNNFIGLILGISFFLLILIIIPIIIGLIPISNFNINFLKFVSINYLIDIICIIIFEVILLLGIIPFFKTINIKKSSDADGSKYNEIYNEINNQINNKINNKISNKISNKINNKYNEINI